ncbi:leukocyte elastase inhibitor-like isoform X2 [Epinephelus fuscoguttatus]|uniref:leukocyte elastase inhibitor-like isoform X2 n=1 Tax=Epinephelus fuscoguttatus TaxID=293821 RepID=UPI0020D0F029|nr:leukocyte elastase inhibitor-like isoform X2 [Epinephelus fuscoguttatus]
METTAPSKITKANTTFLLALFKKLSNEDKTGNIFFSPFSISSALAMVMMGAGGNTATQMSKVLCFTEEQQPASEEAQPTDGRSAIQSQMQHLKPQDDEENVHSSFAKLLTAVNKPDDAYALSTANRLYGEKTFEFKEEFLAETQKHYQAELEPVDFIKEYEAARVHINEWVEEQTKGKIKDLLVEGVLDDKTKLVLVNAIYFKGFWNQKFNKDETVDAQFRINKSDTKPVKMMSQKSEFLFTMVPDLSFKILEMRYKGEELSMFIFLPNDIEDDTTGLEKLEAQLTYEKFVEWTRSDLMRKTDVKVGLPRFKLEETYDMKNVLVSMGMVDAFDVGKSDFCGLSTATNLVLSKVVHKSFVDVNEEGTEAAAATAASVSVRSLPPTFVADHPFLFFIRHNSTNSILFAGRYCSPE